MGQVLSHVLFHPYSLQSHSTDSCPRNEQVRRRFLVVQQGIWLIFHSHFESFSRRRESDVPLTKTVLLPPTVEGDNSVTLTSDILAHCPRHRVTGSGSKECHAVFQFDPEIHTDTEAQVVRKT